MTEQANAGDKTYICYGTLDKPEALPPKVRPPISISFLSLSQDYTQTIIVPIVLSFSYRSPLEP